MALFENVYSVIRQALSRAVGDLILSTPSAVSSTTLTDTNLLKADDYYNDHGFRAYCYSGTAIGQEREITDWIFSTKVLTLSPACNPAPAVGDKFELHYIFTEAEYRNAINLAIDSIAQEYLLDQIDATTTLVAATYEYTLPTGFLFIHKITTEKTAGGGVFDADDEIDPRTWELISARKLKLHEDYYSITAGKDLRIEGQKRQAQVTADTDKIYLPPDWLINKAITLLPTSKIWSNKLDAVYRNALLLSQREPRRSSYPFARRVIE